MIYTIQGVYSDKYGAFTLTCDLLGLAEREHHHTITDITDLANVLSLKSSTTHTHPAISYVQVNATKLTNTVIISIIGGSLSVDQNTITLSSDITVNVSLDNAPAIVNQKNGKPSYLFFESDWNQLDTVKRGSDYSVGILTDAQALVMFNKQVAVPVKSIFLYNNGSVTQVQKVITSTGDEYFPPPAYDKLAIVSSIDDVTTTHVVEGEQRPLPMINETTTSLEVTVTPYPNNGKWYLSCNKFSIPETVYTGKQTVVVEIPVTNIAVGTHVVEIKAIPKNEGNTTMWGSDADSCGVCKFVLVIRPESDLQPAYYWPLNGSTEESVTKQMGVYYGGSEGAQPVYVDNPSISGKAFQCDNGYQESQTLSGIHTPNIDIDLTKDDYRGTTISMFVQRVVSGRNEETYTRWMDPNDANTELGFGTTYGNISWRFLHHSSSANVDGYISNEKYYHLAMTISKPLTKEDGVTDDALAKGRTFRVRLYANGNQVLQYDEYVDNAEEYRLRNIGGANHNFVIGAIHKSRTQCAHYIDEVKIFDKEMSIEEIRQESMLAGFTFDSTNEGGTSTEPPVLIADEPRRRENKPTNIAEVPLQSNLKVFVIDHRTIAVAGNYEEFYNNRLQTEYTTSLRAMERNYRNGLRAEWIHQFYYEHSMYELQADYEPRILDAYDSDDYFKIDGQSVTWLGSWSNASGAMEVPDVYDQTQRYLLACANIVHVAYLQLPFDLIESNSYQITDNDGNACTFTYDQSSPSRAIKVNQEGYPTNSQAKVAYLGAWLGSYGTYPIDATSFALVNEEGSTVYTGEPVLREVQDTFNTTGVNRCITGEKVYELDFSSFNTPGVYRIHIDRVGYSFPFTVGDVVTEKLFFIHTRGLYHQRSGIEKTLPYTEYHMEKDNFVTYEAPYPGEDKNLDGFKDSINNWTTLTAFDIIANNWRNIPHREVYGGWWDAADWDRRDYHLNAVRALTTAYLMYPSKFADNQLNIPESGNGCPDILSEAMWGIDIWRRAQREDGGVGCWVESEGHPTQMDASKETRPFCMAEPTAYSSINYAIAAAQLSRALKLAGNVVYADLYADSAIRAFNWGVNNLAHIECVVNLQSYTYDEPAEYVSDLPWIRYRKQIMFWAAGELYLLTGELKYAKYLTDEYWEEYKAFFDIDDNFFYNVFWELVDMDLDPYSTYMKEWILEKAERWSSSQDQFAYRELSFPPNSSWTHAVAWGNCHPGKRGCLYAAAYYITKDNKWLKYIQYAINWLTGCNALGRTLTTGIGVVSPVRILSKIDQLRRQSGKHDPTPGITSYTYGNNGVVSEAVNYVYLLQKNARTDSNYLGCLVNMMPGRLRQEVSTTAGAIASYLEQHLPLWRSHIAIQDYAVSMNEFTIHETIAYNTLLLAALLPEAGWVPNSAWYTTSPVTDPKNLEGYIFLP